MKAKEIREFNDEQLKEKLKELNLQLFNDRFSAGFGTLENPAAIRNTRKDIARVKTILSQRGIKV